MSKRQGSRLKKPAYRYYSSVALVYVATLLFGFFLFSPRFFVRAQAVNLNNIPTTPSPSINEEEAVSGRPVKMQLKRLGIEMDILPGYFDKASATWTLADYETFFAMPSALANNKEGNTIIYDHNNDHVFKPLNGLQTGDELIIYTDNGLIFSYTYSHSQDVRPNDVSTFHYEGAPIVTLLTCEGSLDEWRRLYSFSLSEVVK